jgi:hypothetical protein
LLIDVLLHTKPNTEHVPENNEKKNVNYAQLMMNQLNEARNLEKQRITMFQHKKLLRYNHCQDQYSIGELVWVYNPYRKKC